MDFDVSRLQVMGFYFFGGSTIMNYEKNINDGFVFFLQTLHFSIFNVNWWTAVEWITSGLLGRYISCLDWRQPFTAEDPLVI